MLHPFACIAYSTINLPSAPLLTSDIAVYPQDVVLPDEQKSLIVETVQNFAGDARAASATVQPSIPDCCCHTRP